MESKRNARSHWKCLVSSRNPRASPHFGVLDGAVGGFLVIKGDLLGEGKNLWTDLINFSLGYLTLLILVSLRFEEKKNSRDGFLSIISMFSCDQYRSVLRSS